MSRKPYQSPMPASWWLKHPAYRFYMLREATVLPLLFFVASLLYGLYALGQGENSWLQYLSWLQQPWVIALNSLALVASLFHAWTFFVLFPQVMPLRLGSCTLPACLMVSAQWAGVLLVILALWWLLGGMNADA
ncbi:fumarate reductase subunit C [Alkalimonas delamerensis]|uniref:Fumarate reductase subunit C n=1 Tax=Alkalimonas delamerensis TaxID=265981 RepID=A0ABT9GLH7_9GAMM|nr:fumarate reductase subunit C [Alkalimonas delamerensis]MDP4527789.1 fumarate reductase subunit C [Alkalimonas delamerensis]